MEIKEHKLGTVLILDCARRITLGHGTPILRNAIQDALKKGEKKIILNLADVNYIDSTGIEEFVSNFTTVTNQGGKLKLLNLTKKIQELLAITKLLTVFQVYDDEKVALASFDPYVAEERV